MVELHLADLDLGAQGLGAAFRLHQLQLGEFAVHFLAQQVGGEAAALEQSDGVVDVVGQEARARALAVVVLRGRALEAGFEQGVASQVGVASGAASALDAAEFSCADANHRARSTPRPDLWALRSGDPGGDRR